MEDSSLPEALDPIGAASRPGQPAAAAAAGKCRRRDLRLHFYFRLQWLNGCWRSCCSNRRPPSAGTVEISMPPVRCHRPRCRQAAGETRPARGRHPGLAGGNAAGKPTYKLSERGEVLAAGQLLRGANSLLVHAAGVVRREPVAVFFARSARKRRALAKKNQRHRYGRCGSGNGAKGKTGAFRILHAGNVPCRPPDRLQEKKHARSPEPEDQAGDPGARSRA